MTHHALLTSENYNPRMHGDVRLLDHIATMILNQSLAFMCNNLENLDREKMKATDVEKLMVVDAYDTAEAMLEERAKRMGIL